MAKLTEKGELVIAADDDLIHVVDISDVSGSPQGTSKKMTIVNLKSAVLPSDNCRIGLVDYNDAATAGTPLVVTEVGSPVPLPNDGLGAFTNKIFIPDGITDIWDTLTDKFDFTELSLGDMIDIRLDVALITSSVNTQIKIDMRLGIGGSEYLVPFIPEVNFKDTGTHPLTRFNGIYMGDTNTLNNGAHFEITTDKDCTIIVNGWYCKILIRG